MSDVVFELENVCYAFQGQPALNGLSLQIRRGERIALLGANGSGKSTLLRLLDALYFAQSGQLSAFGEVVSEDSMADEARNFAFRQRVGLVFQNPDVQLFNPTVFDELAFGPLQLGWDKARIMQRVEQMLERFAIAHLKQRAPHRLSGGEKKRVALASVLIVDPEVVLLDEPTAALDPESQGEIIRFLMACRQTGQTVITATHELDIVADIADRVWVLADGKIAGEGRSAEILENETLLRQTRLLHTHWHAHADGEVHAHPHRHRPGHEHVHAAFGYRPRKGS
jgi:cobalt/nickel transport system ATP-binding protein